MAFIGLLHIRAPGNSPGAFQCCTGRGWSPRKSRGFSVLVMVCLGSVCSWTSALGTKGRACVPIVRPPCARWASDGKKPIRKYRTPKRKRPFSRTGLLLQEADRSCLQAVEVSLFGVLLPKKRGFSCRTKIDIRRHVDFGSAAEKPNSVKKTRYGNPGAGFRAPCEGGVRVLSRVCAGHAMTVWIRSLASLPIPRFSRRIR